MSKPLNKNFNKKDVTVQAVPGQKLNEKNSLLNDTLNIKPLKKTQNVKMPSSILSDEIKKKEEELRIVRELINQKSENEIQQIEDVLNKSRKKSGILKPVDKSIQRAESNRNNSKSKSKIQSDPHKRLIDQIHLTGTTSNILFEKTSVDDKEFRKTFMKTQKIMIDCEPGNAGNAVNTSTTSIMSKSLIRFDLDFDEGMVQQSESKFNNLVRGQIMQEYHQVSDFLESLGLNKYVDTFISNGVDEIDKIKQLNEERLKLMEIPYGHRNKIIKKVSTLVGINTEISDNQREVSNHINEELPRKVNNKAQIAGIKSTSSMSSMSSMAHHQQLQDDTYDEQLQRKLFQQAVEEFRRGKQTSQVGRDFENKNDNSYNPRQTKYSNTTNTATLTNNSDKINQEKISNVELQEPQGKGFLYNLGNNLFDFNNFALFEENGSSANIESNAEVKNFLPINKPKLSCWVCYKLITEETSLKIEQLNNYNKVFCTKVCMDNYIKESLILCHDSGCENKVEKNKSIFYKSNYYCSIDCMGKNYIHIEEKINTPESENNFSEEDIYDPMTDF